MRLHASRVGDSDSVVVFLHGLLGRGKNFVDVASRLRPDFSSILIDLPDHGESSWSDAFDYAASADAVASTLDALLDGRRAHVVGHSMGGKVAMVLATAHPHLVASLVVVDIAPAPSDAAARFEPLFQALASLDLSRLESRKEASQALRQRVPDEELHSFLLQNVRRRPDGLAWQPNLEVLRRDIDIVGGFPVVAGPFVGPVLWVAGGLSDYVKSHHVAPMIELFPRVRCEVIQGAGHWVHADRPDDFAASLRKFLAVHADGVETRDAPSRTSPSTLCLVGIEPLDPATWASRDHVSRDAHHSNRTQGLKPT